MKQTRYRIIELPEYQILLKKDYDEEDDKETFSMSVYIDGITASNSYGYDTEEERNEWFEKVTDSQAQVFVDNIIKMINSAE